VLIQFDRGTHTLRLDSTGLTPVPGFKNENPLVFDEVVSRAAFESNSRVPVVTDADVDWDADWENDKKSLLTEADVLVFKPSEANRRLVKRNLKLWLSV
jgi:hypothetical protein